MNQSAAAVGADSSVDRVVAREQARTGVDGRPSDHLRDLIARFNGEPLAASFRQMVGPLAADEHVHQLHPYPARLTRHIPRLILKSGLFATESDVVLDPFMGSGTVAVEAQLLGYEAWGIDSNPLARLIASVKTGLLNYDQVAGAIDQNHRRALSQPGKTPLGLDYWFNTAAGSAIASLRKVSEGYDDVAVRNFFKLTLSRTVHELAHKDPRVPVPVRPRNTALPALTRADVLERHKQVANAALSRLRSRPHPRTRADIRLGDARRTAEIFREASIAGTRPGLVITSPPYGAAQKYLRSSSLGLYAIGEIAPVEMPALDASTIGREKLRGITTSDPSRFTKALLSDLEKIGERNPGREKIYSVYFHEMGEALRSAAETLRPGGHFVLIASDNTVAGLQIPTHRHLASVLQGLGLVELSCIADSIHARSFSTKRHSSASQPIATEFVHIFRKVQSDS